MANYLDKAGLITVLTNLKNYVDNLFTAKLNGYKIVKKTESEYKALSSYDANTIYVVV